MLSLSFMRHANTDLAYCNVDDITRPITRNGQKKTRIVCKHLKTIQIKFDLIFCSPSLRTKETLKCMLENNQWKKAKIIEDFDIYNGSEENFLLKLSNTEDFKNLLVITHEPQIESFVNYFLAENQNNEKFTNYNFVPSSLITIEFKSKSWKSISSSNAIFKRFIDPNTLIKKKNKNLF